MSMSTVPRETNGNAKPNRINQPVVGRWTKLEQRGFDGLFGKVLYAKVDAVRIGDISVELAAVCHGSNACRCSEPSTGDG